MGQRNVHSYRPNSFLGHVCLILSYFPPTIGALIILVIAVPYFRSYIYWVLWHHGFEGLAVAFGTTALFGTVLIFVAYWKCLTTSPGYVDNEVWSSPPTSYSQLQQGTPSLVTGTPRNPFVVYQLARGGELRWCKMCSLYKPDDAHHCQDCGRCVERMDHHCPWINNCVGRETEKYFLQFLMHIAWTGCFMAGSIGYGLWSMITVVDAMSSIVVIMVAIGAGVFGSVLLCFGGFHVFMLVKGITTIDFMIARRTGQHLQAQHSASQLSAKRKQVLDAVFGLERPWWVYVLPTTPVRSHRRGGQLPLDSMV